MKTSLALVLAFCCCPAAAEVLHLADLTSRQTEKLDRARTVLIVPGGILEEHGPYLPNGTDGIFNQRLANDLADAIGQRQGWTAVLLPPIPLGSGAANEIGARYSFPGSVTILPPTLRSVFMDLADQLGVQGFRWIFVVHGHGDPAHNRMLDEAGDYFHDTYGGSMVNVFGYVWAMPSQDFRTPDQQAQDGLAEHATLTETSVILALQPRSVASDLQAAAPQTGRTIADLQRIAKAPGWPGYFGAPALASPELGAKIYDLWLRRAKDLVFDVLAGKSIAALPRFGTLYSDDPADAAAAAVNAEAESRHAAWLARRNAPPAPAPPSSQPQAEGGSATAKPAAPPPNLEAYQLVILQRPEHPRDYPQDKLEEIQQAHLAHLRELAKAGKLLVAGPLDDQPDPRMRGIEIFRVGSLEEAKRLAAEDPAVKAGRLEPVVMTWYTEKGALAFPVAEKLRKGE